MKYNLKEREEIIIDNIEVNENCRSVSVLGREVKHVQLASSYKDKNQIAKLMQKANDAIDRHFYLIFQKIESLNTNSQN